MPAYPPEAPDRFSLKADHTRPDGTKEKVEIEDHAVGFRMSFPTTAKKFAIEIDMPAQAAPGPYMFNFYVSVYPAAAHESSLVETGISYSGNPGVWKFSSNARGHGNGSFSQPYQGNPLGKRLPLAIDFAALGKHGQIGITLGGQHQVIPTSKPLTVGRIRLVAAAGNMQGASWSSMGMALVTLDGKPPAMHGHAEWMRGANVPPNDRRLVFESASAHGFRCSLPPV